MLTVPVSSPRVEGGGELDCGRRVWTSWYSVSDWEQHVRCDQFRRSVGRELCSSALRERFLMAGTAGFLLCGFATRTWCYPWLLWRISVF